MAVWLVLAAHAIQPIFIGCHLKPRSAITTRHELIITMDHCWSLHPILAALTVLFTIHPVFLVASPEDLHGGQPAGAMLAPTHPPLFATATVGSMRCARGLTTTAMVLAVRVPLLVPQTIGLRAGGANCWPIQPMELLIVVTILSGTVG